MPALPPFETDRPDGRFVSTAGWIHRQLRDLKPKLAFDASMPAEGFDAWRDDVRAKLLDLMAFPYTPEQPAPRQIDAQPRDGFELQTWELYPEPGLVVLFMLLVPDGLTGKAPAVMCFPGSQQPMECLAGDPEPDPEYWSNKFGEHNHMAAHFARKGMIALIMENPSTSSSHDPRCPDWKRQSEQLHWLGRSYEGMSVFQKHVALQWLRERSDVDASRIAMCGHSLGAKPALVLGVLEPDIAAVIWNDHAANWREREVAMNLRTVAPWHYINDFANWFDYMDLMAALAPRPLLVTEGCRGPERAMIGSAYTLAGAPDAFAVSWMPNFRDAANRPLDHEPIPEGVDGDEYARYAGYDSDHYFKDDVAVPWLCDALNIN